MKAILRPSSVQPEVIDHQAVMERHRDLEAERQERSANITARIHSEERRLREAGYDPNHVTCYEADRLLNSELKCLKRKVPKVIETGGGVVAELKGLVADDQSARRSF